MKKIILTGCCILFLAGTSIAADTGEAIFKSQGCASCHHQTTSSKVNPSLPDIAVAYKGKESQLVAFFKGETEAIVKPEKAGSMKRYIEKTKALSDVDRKALTDFVMHFAK